MPETIRIPTKGTIVCKDGFCQWECSFLKTSPVPYYKEGDYPFGHCKKFKNKGDITRLVCYTPTSFACDTGWTTGTFRCCDQCIEKVTDYLKRNPTTNKTCSIKELPHKNIDKFPPGARLQNARRIENLTQAQLSDAVGIAASHISEMENGHRGITAKTAKKLVTALHIDYRLLL